jgi:predicted RNA-binding protein with PIN domain
MPKERLKNRLVTLNRQLAAAAEVNRIAVGTSKYQEQAAYWQQRADRISNYR